MTSPSAQRTVVNLTMGTSDVSDWSVSSDLKTKENIPKITVITDDDIAIFCLSQRRGVVSNHMTLTHKF